MSDRHEHAREAAGPFGLEGPGVKDGLYSVALVGLIGDAMHALVAGPRVSEETAERQARLLNEAWRNAIDAAVAEERRVIADHLERWAHEWRYNPAGLPISADALEQAATYVLAREGSDD